MHCFFKKVDDIFSCPAQNTGRQRRFNVKIKEIKRSNMITFLFSVHTITEAKQYAPWCSAANETIKYKKLIRR